MVRSAWDKSKKQCGFVHLVHPTLSLISDVSSLVTISFVLVGAEVGEGVEQMVLGALSNLTRVPRGVLELSKNVIIDAANRYFNYTVNSKNT